MKRHLVLLTTSFPHGDNEPFVESEFMHLAPHFDRITIVSDKARGGQPYANIPQHATSSSFQARACRRDLFRLLNPRHVSALLRELPRIQLRLKQRISLGVLKILIADYLKTLSFVRHLEKTVRLQPDEQYYFYAYWHDHKAHAIARLKQRHPNIITVARFHGWDIYADLHPFQYLPFKKCIFMRLDVSYSISEHGRTYAFETLGVPTVKVRLARLGTPPLQRRPTLSSTSPLQLLSVSHVIKIKRVHLIVEALSLLEIPLTWTHVGHGSEEADLAALARAKLGRKPNIEFHLAGHLDHGEVMSVMLALVNPLFINVSSSEGIPVSIMEAMSAGIPAIATAVGGTAEIVVDRMNGALLPAHPSPEAIAVRILEYEALAADRKRSYREAAFETWSHAYDANVNFSAFARDLLSLGGPATWTPDTPMPARRPNRSDRSPV